MSECAYSDATCPCQDGDLCHYEGDDPMAPPMGSGDQSYGKANLSMG